MNAMTNCDTVMTLDSVTPLRKIGVTVFNVSITLATSFLSHRF